jgi:hypothetical protein
MLQWMESNIYKYISPTSNGVADYFPIVSWCVSFNVVIEAREESAAGTGE